MSSAVSRVLVVAAGLPVVLGAVWVGGWWLVGLALVVAFVALHEYAALIRPLRPLVLACYLSTAAMLVAADRGGLEWLLGAFLSTLLFAFVLEGVSGTRQPPTVAIGSTILGSAWIGLGVAHLLLVRELPEHGRLALLTVLLSVWAADTIALFAGRLVGRHKLAPVRSPGKTWEGFFAGSAAAVAVVFFALYEERDTFLEIWQSLVLGAVIAIAAVLGDLFESTVKRDMQVKDTGRLLGGHGGVLDRIDALLFAVPVAYYVIIAFGHG
jgi:phosphatidate cytidylyltransferase